MSATADKARYFLEQSVPELKEFERKKIFSPEEITSIAKKRSDFEHKINAKGSSPSDYARYAEFEINVDALRRRRVKRMGIKSTTHTGQRRIYFVFDRGTRKFPGDVDLWMQSIEYARRQKAYKKLLQMFTTLLRLHPAKSELWIYAAQFAIDENGDMTEARSYLQRGLRFCKNKESMWLEYARLELAYLAKVHARRQILGIGTKQDEEPPEYQENEEISILRLPTTTAEDFNLDEIENHDIDREALESLDITPVMIGAIPRAIFDAAVAHFQYEGSVVKAFFDLFADFIQVPASSKILDHIVVVSQSNAADAWQTQACYVSRPLVGLSCDQPEFPAGLRETIRRAHEALSSTKQKEELLEWYKGWLRLRDDESMDIALQQVIRAHLQALDTNSTMT